MDDSALVKGLLQKEPVAERYFYAIYGPKLRRYASFVLGYRDAEVEDVVQETFLAALKDLPKFEFRSSLHTWLRRICVNRCFERIRSRDRQVATETDELEALVGPREEKQNPFLEALREGWGLLGKHCREILDLRDKQEKTYGEIADALKMPVGTVMSRLARCKGALRELVKKAAKRRGLIHG